MSSTQNSGRRGYSQRPSPVHQPHARNTLELLNSLQPPGFFGTGMPHNMSGYPMHSSGQDGYSSVYHNNATQSGVNSVQRNFGTAPYIYNPLPAQSNASNYSIPPYLLHHPHSQYTSYSSQYSQLSLSGPPLALPLKRHPNHTGGINEQALPIQQYVPTGMAMSPEMLSPSPNINYLHNTPTDPACHLQRDVIPGWHSRRSGSMSSMNDNSYGMTVGAEDQSSVHKRGGGYSQSNTQIRPIVMKDDYLLSSHTSDYDHRYTQRTNSLQQGPTHWRNQSSRKVDLDTMASPGDTHLEESSQPLFQCGFKGCPGKNIKGLHNLKRHWASHGLCTIFVCMCPTDENRTKPCSHIYGRKGHWKDHSKKKHNQQSMRKGKNGEEQGIVPCPPLEINNWPQFLLCHICKMKFSSESINPRRSEDNYWQFQKGDDKVLSMWINHLINEHGFGRNWDLLPEESSLFDFAKKTGAMKGPEESSSSVNAAGRKENDSSVTDRYRIAIGIMRRNAPLLPPARLPSRSNSTSSPPSLISGLTAETESSIDTPASSDIAFYPTGNHSGSCSPMRGAVSISRDAARNEFIEVLHEKLDAQDYFKYGLQMNPPLSGNMRYR